MKISPSFTVTEFTSLQKFQKTNSEKKINEKSTFLIDFSKTWNILNLCTNFMTPIYDPQVSNQLNQNCTRHSLREEGQL